MQTANVSPGKPRVNGAVFRAPVGTVVPTDCVSALAEAFKDLGYVSDAGMTNSNTAEKTQVYAWGGNQVMNATSKKPDTFTATFIEALNPNVLKTVYGDAHVIVNENGKTITVEATSDDPEYASYVIDMALKGGAMKRIVIPKGELSEMGEIVYKDDEPIGYKLTIAALDDGSGKTHYEYIKLPEAAS